MLNLLHEGLKHKGQDILRVDLLGEEALNKGLSYFGKAIGNEEKLYQATLAGDVIGNTIYYSLIGAGGIAYIWPRAVFYGLSAGIGAIKLPRPMGLDSSPVTKSNETKILTVTYYLAGALATALIRSSAKRKQFM